MPIRKQGSNYDHVLTISVSMGRSVKRSFLSISSLTTSRDLASNPDKRVVKGGSWKLLDCGRKIEDGLTGSKDARKKV